MSTSSKLVILCDSPKETKDNSKILDPWQISKDDMSVDAPKFTTPPKLNSKNLLAFQHDFYTSAFSDVSESGDSSVGVNFNSIRRTQSTEGPQERESRATSPDSDDIFSCYSLEIQNTISNNKNKNKETETLKSKSTASHSPTPTSIQATSESQYKYNLPSIKGEEKKMNRRITTTTKNTTRTTYSSTNERYIPMPEIESNNKQNVYGTLTPPIHTEVREMIGNIYSSSISDFSNLNLEGNAGTVTANAVNAGKTGKTTSISTGTGTPTPTGTGRGNLIIPPDPIKTEGSVHPMYYPWNSATPNNFSHPGRLYSKSDAEDRIFYAFGAHVSHGSHGLHGSHPPSTAPAIQGSRGAMMDYMPTNKHKLGTPKPRPPMLIPNTVNSNFWGLPPVNPYEVSELSSFFPRPPSSLLPTVNQSKILSPCENLGLLLHEDLNKFGVDINTLVGSAPHFAKDQRGCRMLQRKIEEANQDVNIAIFRNLLPVFPNLMIDPFGNYLCQKIIEVANCEQLESILQSISHKMGEISNNSQGTRVIQKLLEHLKAHPHLLAQLENSLTSHIVELCQDMHGNHVIQRSITVLPSKYTKFIYHEIILNVVQIGTHPHGCCVLQKCLELGASAQRRNLAEEIISNLCELIEDPYGNYVVQYVLKLGDTFLNNKIAVLVKEKIVRLSKNKFSSHPIEMILEFSSDEGQNGLIQEICLEHNLAELLLDQFGNYIIQRVLRLVPHTERDTLLQKIRPLLNSSSNSQFSQRISNKFQKKYYSGRMHMGGGVSDGCSSSKVPQTYNKVIIPQPPGSAGNRNSNIHHKRGGTYARKNTVPNSASTMSNTNINTPITSKGNIAKGKNME